MTRLFDTLWKQFCVHLQDHEFAHENERWTSRAGQNAWGDLVGAVAGDARLRQRALADLLMAALEQVVASPDELPSADALVIERAGGAFEIVITPTLALVDRRWGDDIRERSDRSREIAELAYAPIWRRLEPGAAMPLDPLLGFHEFGPALSLQAVLYELVEEVAGHPDAASWLDRERGAWHREAVGPVMAARLTLLLGLWEPPTRPVVDVSTELQRTYLLGMVLAGISQQRAHKAETRLTAGNRAALAGHYTPFVDGLVARPVPNDVAWTVRFLACFDSLGGDPAEERDGEPTPRAFRQLESLQRQAARGWPGWMDVISTDWQHDHFSHPLFGSRAMEPVVQNYFQALAGLMGPGFLISERGNAGRARYPQFCGAVSRRAWVTQKLRLESSSWQRVVPPAWKLLEHGPDRSVPGQVDEWYGLWSQVDGFLAGAQPALSICPHDAHQLAEELATAYRAAGRALRARRIVIPDDRFAVTPGVNAEDALLDDLGLQHQLKSLLFASLATLDGRQRAERLDLWRTLAAFLHGGLATLPICERDAENLTAALRAAYQADAAALSSAGMTIDPEHVQVRVRATYNRWTAARRMLLDALGVEYACTVPIEEADEPSPTGGDVSGFEIAAGGTEEGWLRALVAGLYGVVTATARARARLGASMPPGSETAPDMAGFDAAIRHAGWDPKPGTMAPGFAEVDPGAIVEDPAVEAALTALRRIVEAAPKDLSRHSFGGKTAADVQPLFRISAETARDPELLRVALITLLTLAVPRCINIVSFAYVLTRRGPASLTAQHAGGHDA